MSEEQVDWLERGFSHPAFRALNAQGAPSVVLQLDPVRAVWASSSAESLFGTADLDRVTRLFMGPRGVLAQAVARLARELQPGSGPRLHRVRGGHGPAWRPLTLLCQRPPGPAGSSRLALTVLDPGAVGSFGSESAAVRRRSAQGSEDPDGPLEPAPAGASPPAGDMVETARERLRKEFSGFHAWRFLWRTDPSGRVLQIEGSLFDRLRAAVRPEVQASLAATVAEFAPREAERLEEALASRKAWSRITILWPLAEHRVAVPVRLAGSPQYDSGREFAGFRGFGVVDLANAVSLPDKGPAIGSDEGIESATDGALPGTDPTTPAAVLDTDSDAPDAAIPDLTPVKEEPQHESSATHDQNGERQRPLPPANVVQLRPHTGSAMADRELPPDRNGSLSSSEHFAFQEIARALAGQILESEPAADRADVTEANSDGQVVPVSGIGKLGRPEDSPASTAPFEAGLSASRSQAGEHGSRASAVPWRALLDSATEAIAALDQAGCLLTINRQGERWFGRDRSQLMGQRLSVLLGPENNGIVAALLGELESRPGMFVEASREFVMRMPEGTFQTMILTLARIDDGLFSAVWRDLSGIKRLERELTRAELEAERIRRQQAEFLAKASHEIRSPLNAILGFAEIMMDERFGPLGTARYKDYLQDIHASGLHVVALIEDLLDLSRIEAGQLELRLDSVDLNKVTAGCVGQLQPQANRERVIVRTSFGAHLPPVVADEHSVRQIVTSLLCNAVKFNEPGGQVIVSTAVNDAGHVVARIRDTGLGMSDADITAALEPFRQLVPSNHAAGTGLGLPLTKALAGANGATLSIRSRPGEGTLVEVSFGPATAAPARMPA